VASALTGLFYLCGLLYAS